jgi:hypothetical protein
LIIAGFQIFEVKVVEVNGTAFTSDSKPPWRGDEAAKALILRP